jgi:mono/diheme cytochrome c family protein
MRILKILGILLVILVVVAAGAATYVSTSFPDVGEAPDIKIDRTPERIARGEYLANNLMGCMDCHAERDFSKLTGPVKPGTEGAGGDFWDYKFGFPGKMYSPNITPTNLGSWTDGEIYRAITAGVNKDGDALFPIMPYPHFGKMPREEIYSVIAYLRTLPERPGEYPERELDFPLNFIVNTMPQKSEEKFSFPDVTNKVEYGKYLMNAAACADCHTPQIKGEYQMDQFLAGGMQFELPDGGISTAANITPHPETGIGKWTEQAFVNRFKQYDESTFVPTAVNKGEFNSIMPWTYYSRLGEEELSAIYTYLQSLEAIDNKVEKFAMKKEAE